MTNHTNFLTRTHSTPHHGKILERGRYDSARVYTTHTHSRFYNLFFSSHHLTHLSHFSIKKYLSCSLHTHILFLPIAPLVKAPRKHDRLRTQTISAEH